MLKLLTTDTFAEWFARLDEADAEDVATALDVVEAVGPEKAAPGSREYLLWYEHPSMGRFDGNAALAWALEDWGAFRDYARRILDRLESPSFSARLAMLDRKDAAVIFASIKAIRRVADPRPRWAAIAREAAIPLRPADACAGIRARYFDALQAAGFEIEDVPAHSLALRELSRRTPGKAFRLLYGVHAEQKTALVVLGEHLDRSFYGDSVRRGERMWRSFLNGQLPAVERAP